MGGTLVICEVISDCGKVIEETNVFLESHEIKNMTCETLISYIKDLKGKIMNFEV